MRIFDIQKKSGGVQRFWEPQLDKPKARSWQTYTIGGACAEKLLNGGIHHKEYLDYAVDVATGQPFCRVKPESLCWDASICKYSLPTCKTCLRRVQHRIAEEAGGVK